MRKELALWCSMCDNAEITKTQMIRKHPELWRNLTLFDIEPAHSQESLEETISDFAESLEQFLPNEHKECLLYAY